MNWVYSADNAPTNNDSAIMKFFFGQTTDHQCCSFRMIFFKVISSSIEVRGAGESCMRSVLVLLGAYKCRERLDNKKSLRNGRL